MFPSYATSGHQPREVVWLKDQTMRDNPAAEPVPQESRLSNQHDQTLSHQLTNTVVNLFE